MPSIVHEGKADGQTTDNLLVGSFPRILEHFIRTSLIRGAQHDQTHGIPCSLARNRGICEEGLLEIIVRFRVLAAHDRNAKAKRSSVLNNLALRSPERLAQVSLHCAAAPTPGIDQTERIQCTALGICSARHRALTAVRRREIWAKDSCALLEPAFVDNAKGRSGSKFGPVGSHAKPFKILSQEDIRCGPAVHVGVLKRECGMVDRRARLE